MSRLHWLELLTDQFSVLEAFPIPILPVEFSQEGATDVRENYIRLRLQRRTSFQYQTKRCV